MFFLDGGVLPHQRSGRLGHCFGGVAAAGADYNKFKVAKFQRFRVSKCQCPKGEAVQPAFATSKLCSFETLNFETLLDAASLTVFT
jgi:hypothetical protein